MNVFVIPEDFRKDQYILKPIISRLMAELGRPKANVRVCQDPLLGGIGEALKWERIEEIIVDRRGMVDLFLLCVDRDGEPGRRISLDHLEQQAAAILPNTKRFFAENAWQEVEVWVLAGHDLPGDWNWSDIRSERELKERYFDIFAARMGLDSDPVDGRKKLAQAAAHHYGRIRQRCPQDIGALEVRVRNWIENP